MSARIDRIDFVNVTNTTSIPTPDVNRLREPSQPAVSEEAVRAEAAEAFRTGAVRAQLSAAGVDVQPSAITSVGLDMPLTWTVHAKSAGHIQGVVTVEAKQNPFLQETSQTLLKPLDFDITVYEPVVSQHNLFSAVTTVLGALGGIAAVLTFVRLTREDEQKPRRRRRR